MAGTSDQSSGSDHATENTENNDHQSNDRTKSDPILPTASPPADDVECQQPGVSSCPPSSPGSPRKGKSPSPRKVEPSHYSPLSPRRFLPSLPTEPGTFQQSIAEPGRKALHDFFYPPRHKHTQQQSHHNQQQNIPPITPPLEIETIIVPSAAAASIQEPPPSPLFEKQNEKSQPATNTTPTNSLAHAHDTTPIDASQPSPHRSSRTRQAPRSPPSRRIEDDPDVLEQDRQDREYVERFWTVYDDIIILSLFTQLGILCRLGMATLLHIFDGVFHKDSALFTNLPLNSLSCFVLGLFCSGESLMEIISTRFTPTRLQHDIHKEDALSSNSYQSGDHDADDLDTFSLSPEGSKSNTRNRHRQRRGGGSRRRRPKTQRLASPQKVSWQPKVERFENELREVQLLALERRIRSSPCLVLFPIKKEDVDVVENYYQDGYRKNTMDSGTGGNIACLSDDDENQWSAYSVNSMPEESICNGSRQQYSLDEDRDILEKGTFSFDDHDLSLTEEVGITEDSKLHAECEEDSSLNDDAIPDERFEDELSMRRPGASPRTSTTVNRQNKSSTVSKQSLRTKPTRNSTLEVPHGDERSASLTQGRAYAQKRPHLRASQYGQLDGGNVIDYGTQDHPDLDQIITNVATDVSQKISRIRRVSLAAGWDVGTSPEEKSSDLMLGLRDGLCGALSSFSSWISSMVLLLRKGNIGQAFVGLILGIQLPIVAYRFGQHVAVYIFIWRCRRETKRDERRGYGIRLSMDEDNMSDPGGCINSMHSGDSKSASQKSSRRTKTRRMVQEEESETPSVRAIITAIFIMALVAQMTALNFYYAPEDRLLALSLLFSPLGVIARWRLSKLNSWRPNFPIGTFTCNIAACALSGTLGTLLAGNPGPRERIALVAIIAGFGGTLSSVARFIVEILAGTDPILFRMHGIYYAVSSVFWGMLVSFLFTASVDWADSTQ